MRKEGRSARLEVWGQGVPLLMLSSIGGVGVAPPGTPVEVVREPIPMQARVEYSLSPDANRATVTLLNLNRRSREWLASMVEPRTSASEVQRTAVEAAALKGGGSSLVLDHLAGVSHLKLFAGYGQQLQQIFEGSPDIIKHWRPDNTTWRTDIDCGDAAARLREAIVSKSWGPGTPVLTTIVDTARTAGISMFPDTQARLAAWLGPAVHEYGYTATGDARAVLDELLRWSLYLSDQSVLERIGTSTEDEVSWTIVNGELVVYGPRDVSPGPPVVISPETGMIGRPRQREGDVVEVSTLMEPRLLPGAAAAVRSRDYTGVARCHRALFEVSTLAEGRHAVTAELHPIKAVGL